MLKVILADDEEIVRTSMAKWIPWKDLGMKLVGTASDGEEAYAMIMKHRPDIVITDIRMPKMDGLELIGRVKEQLADTAFLIISGFGEFDYAQKAMRYGVKHYMLKPALKEELVGNLRDIREEIEKRHLAKLGAGSGENGRYGFYAQRSMLMEILSDPSSVDGVIERMRRLSPFDPDEILTMLVAQVLEPDRFIPVILPALKELGVRIPIHPASAGGRTFFTLDLPSLSLLKAAEKSIVSRGGILISVKRGTPSDLIYSFIQEAGDAKEACIYDWDGHGETVKVLPRGRSEETELIRRYRAALAGEGSDASLVDDIERMFRQKELDEAESLFVMMAMRGSDYGVLFKQLGDVKDMDGLVALARSFIDHKVPSDRDAFPAEAVRRYILDNFSNPEISLKWVSENVVYMNPEYLSRLFQRHVGQRFTDFLNTTRVNEAKKLMAVYHKSTIGEIAEMVGYSNPGYFFHIFRRYTGMTPGEYIDKVRKAGEEEDG